MFKPTYNMTLETKKSTLLNTMSKFSSYTMGNMKYLHINQEGIVIHNILYFCCLNLLICYYRTFKMSS